MLAARSGSANVGKVPPSHHARSVAISATSTGPLAILGTLPLACELGSVWNCSVSKDVVGRLVGVLRGEPLDACFRRYIFEPRGMRDTGFSAPANQHARLATHYVGDVNDPEKPGLDNANRLPYVGALLQPVPRLNPGGGLVGWLDNYTRLVYSLANGDSPLVQPGTMPYVMQDQLPAGMQTQRMLHGLRFAADFAWRYRSAGPVS